MALGAAVLPRHPADKPFKSPERRRSAVKLFCGVPGSEVSLSEILEHRLFQLGLRQKLLEPGVLLVQLSQPPDFLCLHPAVLLPPAVVGMLRHCDGAADIDDGLALGDQLLDGLELADDLLSRVPGAFHGRVPC